MSSLSLKTTDEMREILQRIYAEIPNDNNRNLVTNYCEERLATGLTPSTIGIDANSLRSLCVFLGNTELVDVTKADLIRYVNTAAVSIRSWRNFKAEGSATVTKKPVRLNERTLNQRKAVIKAFFKWLRQVDDWPAEVKWMKIRPIKDKMPTDALITRDDVAKMLAKTRDAQGRARVLVLLESGMRAEEFCSLSLKNVFFDQYGAVLSLPVGQEGLKTGARRVRIFDSVLALQEWFQVHPFRSDPNAPLWVSWSNRAPGLRLSSNALWKWITDLAKEANIGKAGNPHAYRHTAATERARAGWNEAQMRAYFGWSKDSKMPSLYVHLAGLDYERMELERRGLSQEGSDKPLIMPVTCRFCKAENVFSSLFCRQCARPLTPEAEAELHHYTHKEVQTVLEETKAKTAKEVIEELRQALASGDQQVLRMLGLKELEPIDGLADPQESLVEFDPEPGPARPRPPGTRSKKTDDEVRELVKTYRKRFPHDDAQAYRHLLAEVEGITLGHVARVTGLAKSRLHSYVVNPRARSTTSWYKEGNR
jgi:integrase